MSLRPWRAGEKSLSLDIRAHLRPLRKMQFFRQVNLSSCATFRGAIRLFFCPIFRGFLGGPHTLGCILRCTRIVNVGCSSLYFYARTNLQTPISCPVNLLSNAVCTLQCCNTHCHHICEGICFPKKYHHSIVTAIMSSCRELRREHLQWAAFSYNRDASDDPEPYRSLILERQRLHANGLRLAARALLGGR